MIRLNRVNARSRLIPSFCQTEICNFRKHLLQCRLAGEISKIVMAEIYCPAIYELPSHWILNLALDKAFDDRLILEYNQNIVQLQI